MSPQTTATRSRPGPASSRSTSSTVAARLGSRVSSSTLPALRSSSAARRRSVMSVQTTSQHQPPSSTLVADTASSHQTGVPSLRRSATSSTR